MISAEFVVERDDFLMDIKLEIPSTGATVLFGPSGSGKTTFSGKLALFLKNNKKLKPLLVACDVYRPAAIDQLEILSKQVNADFYCERDNKDPVSISINAIKFSKTNNNNLIIIYFFITKNINYKI